MNAAFRCGSQKSYRLRRPLTVSHATSFDSTMTLGSLRKTNDDFIKGMDSEGDMLIDISLNWFIYILDLCKSKLNDEVDLRSSSRLFRELNLLVSWLVS